MASQPLYLIGINCWTMSSNAQPWLVLSHAFNMDGIAASQTVTDKIPHLLRQGIRPIILSAPTGRKDEVLEHHQIFSLLPSGLRYDVPHYLKIRWGSKPKTYLARKAIQLLLLPFYLIEKLLAPFDSHWSWYLSAYRTGIKLVRQHRPLLIFSAGSANCAHLAGYLLAKKTGLPWIAEIHDPMIHQDWRKGRPQYRRAAWIEKLICERADIAYWFTPTALERARGRHPILGNRGRQVIPGANPPAHAKQPYRKSQHFVLAHFGSLARNRNLKQTLHAIQILFSARPEYARALRLRTYGSDWDAVSEAALTDFPFPEIIERIGRLEHDLVTGLSGRQRVLTAMESCDCLLLLHGEDAFCEEYYPSKLYEYFWTQRPILGLVWRNPSLEHLLREQGHSAANAEKPQEIALQLERLMGRWTRDELQDSHRPSSLSVEAAVKTIVGWSQEAVAGIKSSSNS